MSTNLTNIGPVGRSPGRASRSKYGVASGRVIGAALVPWCFMLSRMLLALSLLGGAVHRPVGVSSAALGPVRVSSARRPSWIRVVGRALIVLFALSVLLVGTTTPAHADT